MKRFWLIPAAMAGFGLLVALLYLSVATFAFNTASYPQTPPFEEMAVELTAYLSGQGEALSSTLFTERERLHMVDVLALFQGAKQLALVLGVGAVFFFFAALCFGGRRRAGRGLFIGMGLFAGFFAFLGVWALIDFNGWFTTMHELVFTNDLWLLDPAESMLIQMLPLEFFISAVKSIIIRFGIGAACLAVVAAALQIPEGRKRIDG